MTTKLQLLLLATSVGAACGNAWAAPSYSLTEIVAPGARVSLEYEHNTGAPSAFYGYYLTEFPSMNDNGVIVGRTKKANSSNPLITNTAGQAAKWTGGVKANLQLAGCKDANNDGVADNTSCGSRALNINNAGIAGGSSNDWLAASDTYFEKAYSWSADTLLKKKVGINYSSQSQVEDVNEKGEYAASGITVGGGYPYDGLPHATIETPTAGVIIGVSYQVTTAHAINESRMVAGAAAFNLNNVFTANATNPYMAYRFGDRFIWGGYLPGGTYSDAYDVNDNGLVVGRANTSTGKIHAFKWESKGDGRYLSQDKYGAFKNYSGEVNTFLVDLGSLHSSGESVARSTNNHGHIVGWSDRLVSNVTVKRAFIYFDGAMNDINDLVTSRNGWTFVDAYAVNERGEVLVRGTKAGNK